MKTISVEKECTNYETYRAQRVKSLFNAEYGHKFSISVDTDTAGTADISEPFRASPIWGCEMLKVFIAGQKSFGAAVYKAVKDAGYTITGVACPADGQYYDRLKKAAFCDKAKPVIIDSDKLRSSDILDGTDVIIAAHSHHFISTKAREKVRYAVGYHPSLLPRHRGRDAVKWTVRFGDTVAGGSIYELGEKVDGGAIVLQRSVLVKKEWTYKDLWREALFPLGVQLILETLKMIEDGKYSATPQDESLATWEPPVDQNTRLFRPELMMLP